MKPDSTSLSKGARFEDRYEILGELESESWGRVYRGRQLSTGKPVALKLLGPGEGEEHLAARQVERFRREAQIAASLAHTNIVDLVDSGETPEGQLYAVFAHVPGETLEQVLSRDGPLGVREAVRLMTQVLDALAAAHAQGLVHRDLRPAKLMLSGTGARRNALVLDFGLGGLAEALRRHEWQGRTQARELPDAPPYAAPEQLAGEAATERSDLYAWGLVFLEGLTGRHPLAEAGAREPRLTGAAGLEVPEWLREHRLGQLLEKVTTRDPAKRDVSIEALIETLDEIARGELPEAPEGAPTPVPLAESGERRHLTVLFCDLVGSSALGQRLDAESYRRIVQAYYSRAADAIARYEGHIAQYLGDGLLVYFGYPQAHEDDAERAVRAGQEMLQELAALTPRLEAEHGVRLRARVGIHTGLTVVGEMGGRDRLETMAIGDTLNVAARLEAFAEPDTVVISDATRRLVPGLFVTEDRGAPALKGISEPIRAYRVVQPSGVTSRLERAPRLTPFVGREQELELLLGRFEQAREGRGQAVLVRGEAGIGKSRLVYRLRQRLCESPHGWRECRTSPYTQHSALYPVIDLLERSLGLDDDRSPEERVQRLEREVADRDLEADAAVPLLASLLSLQLPERYAPLEIGPRLQRQRTLEALISWVLARGDEPPAVLLVEDLHWADPSTLEWLELLIERCATARLLLLLTCRPEFEPPWPSREHVASIALARFEPREARDVLAGAVGGMALPEALVDQIARRSDGVPLFVEELAKGVVAAGRDLEGPLSSVQVPETLQDSLTARLDRLGDSKQVAQFGSALGREFPYALLAAIAPLKEAALREKLGQLVEAELLDQQGRPPKATYAFKHALVQETAYQSLLRSQRRELHGRIADGLETLFPERVAREPELLARHCQEADRTPQAIGHYHRAGKRAAERFAHAEACAHLEQALQLLCTLPESVERKEREIELQLALGAVLLTARGPADPEVERVFERARALCLEIGETPKLFEAVMGLERFHWTRGELQNASGLAEQALLLAEQTGDPIQLVTAHTALGMNLANRGELPQALEHLEEGIRIEGALARDSGSDPDAVRARVFAARFDAVQARVFAARTLFLLGYPERAVRRMRHAVGMAREGDPRYAASMLAVAATLHYRLRDRPGAREYAEEAIAMARERELPFPLALATAYRGWALGGPEGLAELRRGVDQFAAIGAESSVPHHLLAEAYREAGRNDDALNEVEAAFAARSETRIFEAELHRVQGEVLLRQGDSAEARRCFQRALEVAQRQTSKTLELRAATSLARLLRDQGRADEALALLAPVYAWFTEGFDTADLKDATALLDELS